MMKSARAELPDRTKSSITVRLLVRTCRAIIIGTIVAQFIYLLVPLLKSNELDFVSYWKSHSSAHVRAETVVVIVALVLIFALCYAKRIWRSFQDGLVTFPEWVWVLSVAAFWISIDLKHPVLAVGWIATTAILFLVVLEISGKFRKGTDSEAQIIEPDLPVAENGEDLLGRQEIVEELVSRITMERPMVIALTGGYGEGKTSVLNLTVGQLRIWDEFGYGPIVVRFSPWLAGDSNALILAMLNSIVAEIKKSYVAPGLSRDALQYAKTLLSAIPKTERLKDFIAEPSQEDRAIALAARLANTPRTVLVVLDDLDRLEPKELDTVFKLLRGSEKLSNFTFLCAFDKNELALILKATRPFQDGSTFIEKFFQLQVQLPKVEPARLQSFFSARIVNVLDRYKLPHGNISKSLEELWESGAGSYFTNLRRIKLFLNRINNSYEQIGSEININDFIRIELIRDIAPSVHEDIYRNPPYFYERDLAFEVAYTGDFLLDNEKGKQRRAAFYEKMMAAVPPDKQYVTKMLENLFPQFAKYTGDLRPSHIYLTDCEKEKRIFHPRFFMQYFLLKVPSEYFSETDFKNFVASLKDTDELKAAEVFNKVFQTLLAEDFKRWHFMHRIENVFEDFELETKRGLCEGMAQNSSIWSSDAFELQIAFRCTRTVILGMSESSNRVQFLRAIIKESASDVYSHCVVWWLEKDAPADLLSVLAQVKPYFESQLRAHYLISDPPSVFEQFASTNPKVQSIDSTQLLFGWRRLGTAAEADQQEYLRNLFTRHPHNLNAFLALLFRVEFLDDYTTLKPLIDYAVQNEI